MFNSLFSTGKIGNCEIKNRLAMTAMVTNYCNTDGTATERYIPYHEEKAKGGWGLIITEDYAINEHCMGYANIAGVYNDSQIESHKELTDRVHQYGTKIFAQIYHAGRQSHAAVNGGVQPLAPSAIPCPWCRDLPRELTRAEIHRIVDEFGACAKRVKAPGSTGSNCMPVTDICWQSLCPPMQTRERMNTADAWTIAFVSSRRSWIRSEPTSAAIFL